MIDASQWNEVKQANRLFKGTHRYKMVLRGFDVLPQYSSQRFNTVEYVGKLIEATQLDPNSLVKFSSFKLRYTIFTSSIELVTDVASLDRYRNLSVTQVAPAVLDSYSIYLPAVPFEYRVTVRKSLTNQRAFLKWAASNKNVKVPQHCSVELSQERSYGGSYFYITGEHELLIAKIHLGSSIGRVEKVVNSLSEE